jgi:hypothetical protein
MIFPVLFIVIGFSVGLVSRSYEIGQITRPKAGLYPLVIGLGLVCVGLIELISIYKAPSRQEKTEENITEVFYVKALAIIALLFLWPVLLSSLGFLIVTFIVTFGTAKVLGLEGWIKPFILALSVTMACHFLFKVWFYLDLPDGLIIEWFKAVLGG